MVIAYTLELRHAVDADHLAAIDNVTRKLMFQELAKPREPGQDAPTPLCMCWPFLFAWPLYHRYHRLDRVGSHSDSNQGQVLRRSAKQAGLLAPRSQQHFCSLLASFTYLWLSKSVES